MEDFLNKSDEEWKSTLPEDVFKITRKKGTEPAFSGKFWDHKQHGNYYCVCCKEKLFQSKTKFDSGTGWPSFFQPVNQHVIEEKSDRSFFMVRTEVLCKKCGAHLGHVFEDGPEPTGLRYCINSASLEFKPEQNTET